MRKKNLIKSMVLVTILSSMLVVGGCGKSTSNEVKEEVTAIEVTTEATPADAETSEVEKIVVAKVSETEEDTEEVTEATKEEVETSKKEKTSSEKGTSKSEVSSNGYVSNNIPSIEDKVEISNSQPSSSNVEQSTTQATMEAPKQEVTTEAPKQEVTTEAPKKEESKSSTTQATTEASKPSKTETTTEAPKVDKCDGSHCINGYTVCSSVPSSNQGIFICVNGQHYQWYGDLIADSTKWVCDYCGAVVDNSICWGEHIDSAHPEQGSAHTYYLYSVESYHPF